MSTLSLSYTRIWTAIVVLAGKCVLKKIFKHKMQYYI